MSNLNGKSYVFFHHPCSDGMMAATIAYESLSSNCVDCVLIPSPPGQPPDSFPNFCKSDQIYLLDTCYSVDILKNLSEITGCPLIIFDHHTYSKDLFKDIPLSVISEKSIHDETRSACRITWDYFFPSFDPPDSVLFVEDRDLWKWRKWQQFPDSKYFTDYFYSMVSIDKDCYRNFLFSEKRDQLILNGIQQGKILGNFIQQQVENLTKSAKIVDCLINNINKKMSIVNSSLFVSEIGHHILSFHIKVDCVLIWFRNESNGKIKASLRSREEEDGSFSMDVNQLALMFGGGGHKTASAFVCDSLEQMEKHLAKIIVSQEINLYHINQSDQ